MDEPNSHPTGDVYGPEPAGRDHFDSLIRLVNLVLRSDSSRSMTEDFPFFLREENSDNLLVCRDGDRVVSHVGLLPTQASYFGHRVKIGMIGAVATHPDYRRRGLATRTLHEAFRRFRRQGGHLLMISGRRDLYFRNGAREVGSFLRYVLERGAGSSGPDDALQLEKAGVGRASEFAWLHRLKPLRFLRPLDEWTLRMGEGVCRNRLSEFCLARRDGEPTAYGIFRVEDNDGSRDCIVTEWGGRPRDALLAVSRRVRQEDWSRSVWTLYPHERHMADVLEQCGARFEGCQAADGSLRIANFPALMEALRGYLAELVGRRSADALEFGDSGGDVFSIALGDERARIEGYGKLAEVIFGTGLDALPESLPDGRLRRTLSALLPLSPMNYDFSYA